MSRGGNDYQSTSPPLLALTRGKQKRDILLEIAVDLIIIITNSPKTVKFQKSANSQCYLGSYRVQEGSEHEILKVESQPPEVDPCFKTILAKECLEYGSSS